jgi:hypothetical protein
VQRCKTNINKKINNINNIDTKVDNINTNIELNINNLKLKYNIQIDEISKNISLLENNLIKFSESYYIKYNKNDIELNTIKDDLYDVKNNIEYIIHQYIKNYIYKNNINEEIKKFNLIKLINIKYNISSNNINSIKKSLNKELFSETHVTENTMNLSLDKELFSETHVTENTIVNKSIENNSIVNESNNIITNTMYTKQISDEYIGNNNYINNMIIPIQNIVEMHDYSINYINNTLISENKINQHNAIITNNNIIELQKNINNLIYHNEIIDNKFKGYITKKAVNNIISKSFNIHLYNLKTIYKKIKNIIFELSILNNDDIKFEIIFIKNIEIYIYTKTNKTFDKLYIEFMILKNLLLNNIINKNNIDINNIILEISKFNMSDKEVKKLFDLIK